MISNTKSARMLLFIGIGVNFGVGIGVGTVLVKTRPEIFALRPLHRVPSRGLASQRPDSRGNSAEPDIDSGDVCTDLSLIPTSRLKQEYDKRTDPSMLADLVNDRFTPPHSTEEALSTAKFLFDRLQPFYTEAPTWKGETSAVTDELAVPLSFLLEGHNSPGKSTSEGFGLSLMMSENPDSLATGQGQIWQARDLRYADDRAFIVLDVQGTLLKKLKGKYTRIAVALPQPHAEDGWIEMLDIDSGKWIKSDRPVQWAPVARKETTLNKAPADEDLDQ